jgi:outer membrane protein assembly factor BamA
MNKSKLIILAIALVQLVISACSTTRRIEDDEQLYTGKQVRIVADSVQLPAVLRDAVTEAVDVAPNNYWSLFGWRYPFPLGLWVYNNWDNPEHGLKHWLYEKLVAEPVLVSDVRPEVRTHMIEQVLDDNGFFSGTAQYELIPGRNKKKAQIRYTITPGPAYPITSVELLPDTCALNHFIDSLARRDIYLGADCPRYSVDSLSVARTRITNRLRNKGYYFFSPEYIEYLADSTATPGQIALRMTLTDPSFKYAMEQFSTGDVTVTVQRAEGGGAPDTIPLRRATLIQMRPSRLRSSTISDNITFRKGRTFSVRDMDRTQTYLSRLGIFNSISIEPKLDTAKAHNRVLDVNIDCTLDVPLVASIEANVTSKTNSYLGPGLTLGITNNNIFGGGEQFSVSATGTYEWQTGRARSSVFNSYEFGLTTSLAFPRLLAPSWIPRSRYQLNWTRFTLNGDLLNRPHFFKMGQFNAAINYDWRYRRYVSNTFTPFKLTYTNLMHTTETFDSIMAANTAVAQSFKSQFIPQMIYTYTFDRTYRNKHTLNWTFSLQEAGNVFWAAYNLCGSKGEKKLFGTPFSQFVKASTQLVYGRRIGAGDSWLVSRVAVGAAHAYGNSSQVPYAEQFYVGGANSVRAFAVRSIGPGSYHDPTASDDGYFDQTGTFKFEANVEYRFPLAGPLHGAIFLDSGNVWLLKSDAQRPGGTLTASDFLRDLAVGTGVGLRFDLSMIVVRGDLGIGIHAPYDTGRGGYYNMTSFSHSLAFHLAIGYPF